MEDERQMVDISSVNQEDADMCKVAAEEGGVLGSPHLGMKGATSVRGSGGGGGWWEEDDDEVGAKDTEDPNSIENMFSDDDETGGVNGGGERAGGIDDKTLAASLGVHVVGGRGDEGRMRYQQGSRRPAGTGRVPRRVPVIGGKKRKGKSKSLTSPAFSPPPAHPIYVGTVLASSQEHAMKLVRESRAGEDSWCKCRKSRCLKLYCDCFQAGSTCKASCGCVDCLNTELHSAPNGIMTNAVINALLRRPDAFSKRVKELGNGCGCKNSGCLKKYCECFREGKSCLQGVCKCQGCKNYEGAKGGGKGKKRGGAKVGQVGPPAVEEGATTPIQTRVTMRPKILTVEDINSATVEVKVGGFGDYDVDGEAATVTSTTISTPNGSMASSGSVDGSPSNVEVGEGGKEGALRGKKRRRGEEGGSNIIVTPMTGVGGAKKGRDRGGGGRGGGGE